MIYESGRPTNIENFGIQNWRSSRILAGKCGVEIRRSIFETFEGCGKKQHTEGGRNVENINW
jgi:hypothetical protein